MMSRLKILGALLAGAMVLAGCNGDAYPKHLKPIPAEIRLRMEAKGMTAQDPILVRIFKEERELEVWKYSRSARKYMLLKSWDICAFSGELGPKLREGDRQSPEGFYAINPGLMNPRSSYHLAFNTGFPNEFDRSHGRTGSHLMVHGDCSSRGCYAMTDEGIEEIYALAREAFNGGQKVFWVHAFPFRMTEENMERHKDHEAFEFWQMLKPGYDFVEETGQIPNIRICDRRYVVNPIFENARFHQDGVQLYASGPCPAYNQPEPSLYLAELSRVEAIAATLPRLTPRAPQPATELASSATGNQTNADAASSAASTTATAQEEALAVPQQPQQRGAISSRWSF